MRLIVGGTGTIGRHVVRELVERGEPPRVLTRDAGRARGLLGPDVDLVQGDLADPTSLAGALEGAARVYLATDGSDQQVRLETGLIAAAARAGVGHLVKVSLIGPAPDHIVPVARHQPPIEEALAASGLPATILRPNWFMDNFLGSADTVRTQGALHGSAGEGRVAFVDARDIAAVAVRALTEHGHAGREHQITGPAALTFAEAAQAIGAGLGREVRYVDLPEPDLRAALDGAGLPGPVADLVLAINANARAGALAEVTTTVQDVTGRPPRSLEAFARDHAAAFLGA